MDIDPFHLGFDDKGSSTGFFNGSFYEMDLSFGGLLAVKNIKPLEPKPVRVVEHPPPVKRIIIPRKEEVVRPIKKKKESDSIMINPVVVGFEPREIWMNQEIHLKDLLDNHFRKRSSKLVKFPHKLYNALMITAMYPNLYSTIGVMWLSNSMIKVNCDVLGQTFGVKRPKASFFNPQGTFNTHNFKVVGVDMINDKNMVPPELLSDVDGTKVKIFKHVKGVFRKNMDTSHLNMCRWAMAKKHSR